MSDFLYPSWQKPLQAAIDEPELQKVLEKMYAAESAIFERMQELSVSPNAKESEALRLACREILKIQIERLKWPAVDKWLSDCAE